jgi:gamma-glutamyltranspeptidase/glutathione hydrolase
VVLTTQGSVACSQPLAAQAGLDILKEGGNAADAAVCVAACLAVLEPCSTGVGGDCFSLFYSAKHKKVFGVNGSGKSGRNANVELARKIGLPPFHGLTVTVPGAVAAWVDILKSWGSGTISLERALQPAIDLARNGFPVAEITAFHWDKEAGKLKESKHGYQLLMKDGRAPRVGEVWRNQGLGGVLEKIAKFGSKAFYEGEIANLIVDEVFEHGGVLTEQDLAEHTTEFVDPISFNYRGIDVFEIVR